MLDRLGVGSTRAALLGVGVSVAACQHAPAAGGAADPTGASRAEAAAPPTPPAPSPPQLLRVSKRTAATHAERDYFLYLPAGHASMPDKLWPVLLVLHGNGERGDAKADLDYLLKNGPLYEAWIQKRDLPFILIVPQLPMYGRDETADYLKNRRREEIPARLEVGVPPRPAEFPTPDAMRGAVAAELPADATAYGPPMGWPELEEDLIGMLDDALRERHGDTTRQYLTGLSYGGFGTWYLASHHPDRFAAIAPVVGYGHPDLMPPIAAAQIPIWCFAGGRDGSVKVKNFYAGLNRLEALGHRELRFTIEADMGHDVWARVYGGNDLYDWLLSHQKRPAQALPSQALSAQGVPATTRSTP